MRGTWASCQGSCDRVVARIFRRGASPLLRAPVAGEELVGRRPNRNASARLVGLVDERHGLVVAHSHGPSTALESVPAVLIRPPPFPCITPSTVTCVMVVSFMGWSFSLMVAFLVMTAPRPGSHRSSRRQAVLRASPRQRRRPGLKSASRAPKLHKRLHGRRRR